MRGHKLLIGGDLLGVTPESTVQEVWTELKRLGVTHKTMMFSDTVIIMFGEYTNYYFKDRKLGRCDFKPGLPPENPACGR